MLSHVLVPLDGSELAETAVPHALELAQRTDSVLCLLRVVPEVPLILDVPAEIALVATQEAGYYLDTVANLLRDQGVPLLLAIRHGSPETKILDYAREVQASMIVMATHNRSGIRRATVGSVTDAVVRRSSCPVLLVHGQPAKSE